jgi:transcriptional regulator with XRE-family HTH domain
LKEYYKILRDLREDNDLKQKDLADKLNISQQYYSQYENGKRELPIRHLIALCKIYNISADYILGFTNDPQTHWTIKNNVTINGGKNKLNFK